MKKRFLALGAIALLGINLFSLVNVSVSSRSISLASLKASATREDVEWTQNPDGTWTGTSQDGSIFHRDSLGLEAVQVPCDDDNATWSSTIGINNGSTSSYGAEATASGGTSGTSYGGDVSYSGTSSNSVGSTTTVQGSGRTHTACNEVDGGSHDCTTTNC